jgi:hypothetical protein
MCVTAIVASAVATVASTTASIGAAKAQSAQQKYALEMERKALSDQREVARIQAAEAEAQRIAEFERNRAANLTQLMASGTRSESFLQGLEAADRQALQLDLANIRSGQLTQDIASMRGIRVNRMSDSARRIGTRYAVAGSVLSGLTSLGQLGQAYSDTRTPSTKPTTKPPSNDPSEGWR